jgi:hypothetical protein
MRILSTARGILTYAIILCGQSFAQESAEGFIISTNKLDSDQAAIYRAFLDSENTEGVLNLARNTFPLRISADGSKGCLKELRLDDLESASKMVHTIRLQELVTKKVIRLVNADEQTEEVKKNDPLYTIPRGESPRR